MSLDRDVVIVGGFGHVGLPLGLAFADRDLQEALYDLNQAAIDEVGAGRMPFGAAGSQAVLERVLLVAKAHRHRKRVAEMPTIWLDRLVAASNCKLANWISKYLRWYFYAFGARLQDPIEPVFAAETSAA